MEIPYDPAIQLLGIYPKNTYKLIWKDTCTPMFIEYYLQYCSQKYETTQVSINRWTDPGVDIASLKSPALAGGFFTTKATWEAPSGFLDNTT